MRAAMNGVYGRDYDRVCAAVSAACGERATFGRRGWRAFCNVNAKTCLGGEDTSRISRCRNTRYATEGTRANARFRAVCILSEYLRDPSVIYTAIL